MIRSKQDLKEYLAQDKCQLGILRKRPRPFLDDIWKYEIQLRKYEYWLNCGHGFVKKLMCMYHQFIHYKKSIKLGISIAPNTCDKGLSIAHHSCIQINNNAKIGQNLRIHEGVTVGASGGIKAPIIGNNVFLGSGCKIIGNVKIADNVAVGAGAVVVKDCKEENSTYAGVPAKKISSNNSDEFVFWYKYRNRGENN